MIETSNRTVQALLDRGHRLLPVNYMGTVQAISIDPETQTISAVSDIRKGGKPSGY
jgi:gamma-glutamyltranspeptidase/glutathione hydrolase/gamma-glutamyltranspeptidase/glutathione hydrolase/leukotriene-C4 hydrolase